MKCHTFVSNSSISGQNSAYGTQRHYGRATITHKTYSIASHAIEKPSINFDELDFSLKNLAPWMYISKLEEGSDKWIGEVQKYGPLEMYPSAQVLNYGQSLIEGMKAYRTVDDRVVLFRPDMHAKRMISGAQRLCMRPITEEEYVNGVKQMVAANQAYVPQLEQGSLYIRPIEMGSGEILGLGAAPSFTFVVYGAAVGNYFKGGAVTPLRLKIEEEYHRSAPGGVGAVKQAGNYSQGLLPKAKAKAQGFDDIICLDAQTDSLLEEVSSGNIFIVKGNTLITPKLRGTFLAGVTRDSVLQIASKKLGYEVEERDVPLLEALEAEETFMTGTAATVAPIGTITYKGKVQYYYNGEDSLASQILFNYKGIQNGTVPDEFGWIVPVL
eukprot:TRINITY_DN3724_c1_g1_i2.p1 TRINITY_DN3724_c1_g1~~TRINITY_DN3724_c1_g1_i2.p1  ORF type:complete len:383 (-),score=67.42 TRINITY_DN3724_c1_g1_i2:216-1364(-)